MRALVKAHAEPGLWMQDVPEPEPGPRDVKIRVHKTSICGTDLHIRHWDAWAQATIPVPMVVGHEFMGEIAEVGAAVAGFEVGQRVAGEGHVTCGHCRNCKAGRREFCHHHTGVGVTRPGAFAEYVVIPAENVFVVPPHISDDVAAILDSENIAVRAGHHCAQPVMDHFGIPGTCRASFSFYNTKEEVEYVVAQLLKIYA